MPDLLKPTLGGWLVHVLRESDSALSLEESLHVILDSLKVYFPSQSAAVILVDPDTNEMRIKISRNISYSFAKEFRRSAPGPVVERVLVGQEAVLINEVPRDSERYNEVKLEHDFVSAALAPIIKNHRAVGYIHCDRAREPLFNDSDLLHLQVIGLLIGSLMVKFELLRERKMLSHVDDASGALKYGAFVPALSRELQRAVAHQYPVVLALIHLPAFRNFLDAYGIDRAHAALADTVKILRGHLREVDLLARYSADHFVVCLSGMGAGEAQALLRTVKEEAERTVGSDTSIPVCVLVGGLVLETDAAKKKPLQDLMAFTGRALLESGDGDANAIRLVRM